RRDCGLGRGRRLRGLARAPDAGAAGRRARGERPRFRAPPRRGESPRAARGPRLRDAGRRRRRGAARAPAPARAPARGGARALHDRRRRRGRAGVGARAPVSPTPRTAFVVVVVAVAPLAVPPSLGLGLRDFTLLEDAELLVYPDLPAASRIAEAVRRGRFRDEGRRTRGKLGLGTEFESIRDYQPDDDIRQVNWQATARVGRPMSN